MIGDHIAQYRRGPRILSVAPQGSRLGELGRHWVRRAFRGACLLLRRAGRRCSGESEQEKKEGDVLEAHPSETPNPANGSLYQPTPKSWAQVAFPYARGYWSPLI